MKPIWRFLWGCLICHAATILVSGQPNIPTMDNLKPIGLVNGFTNLRIISQSPDGSEVLLSMDYTYDGLGGMTAKIIPVIEKKNKPGISGWFGADPVLVSAGRGLLSIKIRYFNDEEGVPPEMVTDRIRLCFLNTGGTAIVGSAIFLKTIHWGNPQAKPTLKSSANPNSALTESQLKAEAAAKQEEARQLAAQKRLVEEKNAAKEKERELALRKAEAEEKARLEAEAKAKVEAAEREEKRLKAELEVKRLAEEQRISQEKAKADLEAQEKAKIEAARKQEQARLQAEAEAKSLAETKRLEEEKAKAQAAALEAARVKAEAEAREGAKLKAQQEVERLAAEQRAAQVKAKAEVEAREKARLEAAAKEEEARLKAEAEAKRLAEIKRQADEKAKAQAAALEEARLRAEVAEKARIEAENKAKAEAAAREEARMKAEREARRMAAEKQFAEEKARQEAAAREAARVKAEAQARKLAQANASGTPATSTSSTVPLPSNADNSSLKTKITNVDVVNRSLDRAKMTIGVEFDYKDNFTKPMLGVSMLRTGDPEAPAYFESTPMEIGRSKRNFVLLPVVFNPPSSQAAILGNYSTDKMLVYLREGATARQFDLFSASMLLMWRAPGIALAQTPATETASSTDSLEFDDLKQNDLYSGYVTVRYRLSAGPGKLQLKVYEASKPESAAYFKSTPIDVPAGRNAQLLEFGARSDASSPSDVIKADTVEVELVDASGKVAAKLAKQEPMSFARPK